MSTVANEADRMGKKKNEEPVDERLRCSLEKKKKDNSGTNERRGARPAAFSAQLISPDDAERDVKRIKQWLVGKGEERKTVRRQVPERARGLRRATDGTVDGRREEKKKGGCASLGGGDLSN